jgi:hypothetical protein
MLFYNDSMTQFPIIPITQQTRQTQVTQRKEVLMMSSRNIITFQEALDIIESLPESQQEDLIELIRRRLIEQKRQKIAKCIREARKEYAKGEVKKGTVDDLMKELYK